MIHCQNRVPWLPFVFPPIYLPFHRQTPAIFRDTNVFYGWYQDPAWRFWHWEIKWIAPPLSFRFQILWLKWHWIYTLYILPSWAPGNHNNGNASDWYVYDK